MIFLTGNITIRGINLPTGTINITSMSGSSGGGWTANYTVYASPEDAQSFNNSLGDASISFPYVAGSDPVQQAVISTIAEFPTLVAM